MFLLFVNNQLAAEPCATQGLVEDKRRMED